MEPEQLEKQRSEGEAEYKNLATNTVNLVITIFNIT